MTTARRRPRRHRHGSTVSWPAGKDGFTVILTSVPTSNGRAQADAAANRRSTNGLTQVGVLNSSDFASLNPGYYVTFTGVYDTSRQAEAASQRPLAGFPIAYVREIAD